MKHYLKEYYFNEYEYSFVRPILKQHQSCEKKSYILSFFIKFGRQAVFRMIFKDVLCLKAGLTHFCIIVTGLIL